MVDSYVMMTCMNKQILFYGDSNTYGYDPRGFFGGRYAPENRWTDILAKGLRNMWDVYAEGRNGRMIPTAPEYPDVGRMIRARRPLDIFACMLGTNDILFGDQSSIDAPVRNMRDFLRFLFSIQSIADQKTKVLLIAPVPIQSGADPVYQRFSSLSENLVTAYEGLSKEFGTLFLNTSGWGIELAYDHVHFSEAGSRLFAEKAGAFILSHKSSAPLHPPADPSSSIP